MKNRMISRLKSGFKIPTIKKIKSALRSKSKGFLINLIISIFSSSTRTEKIKMLVKIDNKSVVKRIKKYKKSKSKKSKVKKSKKRRSAKQRANDKRLGQMAKKRFSKR